VNRRVCLVVLLAFAWFAELTILEASGKCTPLWTGSLLGYVRLELESVVKLIRLRSRIG
jgi:hypothetical protein